MAKTVIAIYDNIHDAQRAVTTLHETAQIPGTSINMLSHDSDEHFSRYVRLQESSSMDKEEVEITKTGAEIGAALGAIGGLLVGLGGVFIPGIGPVIAAGPLVGTLLGTVGGAAAGGLVGALVEAGVPETDAHLYAEALRRGGTIVTVDTTNDDQMATATDILGRYNPVDLEKRAHYWRSQGWEGSYTPDAEIYDSQRITMERESYPEEVRSSTTPYYGTYADTVLGSDWFGRHEPTFREHFDENRPSEGTFEDYKSAYRFGTRFGANQRYARENWNAVQADLHEKWAKDPNAGSWDKVKNYVQYGWYKTKEELWDATTPGDAYHARRVPEYRKHFEANPPADDARYEDYDDAFRFGESLGADKRFAREEWNAVQAEAHKEWAKKHDASMWDKVKNYVQYAWYKSKEEFWDATTPGQSMAE